MSDRSASCGKDLGLVAMIRRLRDRVCHAYAFKTRSPEPGTLSLEQGTLVKDFRPARQSSFDG